MTQKLTEQQATNLAHHMYALQQLGFDLETVVRGAKLWWQTHALPEAGSAGNAGVRPVDGEQR